MTEHHPTAIRPLGRGRWLLNSFFSLSRRTVHSYGSREAPGAPLARPSGSRNGAPSTPRHGLLDRSPPRSGPPAVLCRGARHSREPYVFSFWALAPLRPESTELTRFGVGQDRRIRCSPSPGRDSGHGSPGRPSSCRTSQENPMFQPPRCPNPASSYAMAPTPQSADHGRGSAVGRARMLDCSIGGAGPPRGGARSTPRQVSSQRLRTYGS